MRYLDDAFAARYDCTANIQNIVMVHEVGRHGGAVRIDM